jgi:hypothetical protein
MPLSPEWQLLLACTKTSLTSADVERIHQALEHPQLAWARLAHRACFHGIAPLLYYRLQQIDLTEVLPSAALQVWQRAYYATALTHRLFSQALQRVLRALQAGGTAVIVLKGAALAETVYPSPAVRPMRDVDLLVRAADLARVEDTLRALGYRLTEGPHPKAWWRAQHYHWTFRQPAAPPLDMPLEVHWHLDRPSRPFAIEIEGLWQRAVPTTIAGVDTRILAPEDQLLHLCLHTCRHAGGPLHEGRMNLRLLSFCDLAAVIQHDASTMDWAQLARRAQQWGVAPYVALPLQLARDLVGAAVPEAALAALEAERVDARLLGWVCDELLEDPGTAPPALARLRRWQRGGFRDWAAVLGTLRSPAVRDRAAGSPPAMLRYGNYPVRLAHLVRRFGPVLWRLIRQDPVLTAQAERKVHLAAWLRPFTTRSEDDLRLP